MSLDCRVDPLGAGWVLLHQTQHFISKVLLSLWPPNAGCSLSWFGNSRSRCRDWGLWYQRPLSILISSTVCFAWHFRPTTAPPEQPCGSELPARDWRWLWACPWPIQLSPAPLGTQSPLALASPEAASTVDGLKSTQWLQNMCLAHPPLFWIVTAWRRHLQKDNRFLKFPDYTWLKTSILVLLRSCFFFPFSFFSRCCQRRWERKPRRKHSKIPTYFRDKKQLSFWKIFLRNLHQLSGNSVLHRAAAGKVITQTGIILYIKIRIYPQLNQCCLLTRALTILTGAQGWWLSSHWWLSTHRNQRKHLQNFL